MMTYDDRNLQMLFEELSEKNRKKSLRQAFRKAASYVRKTAVRNLKGSGLRTDRDLTKGIRPIVYKEKLGFRVTIGTKRANKNGKGEAGFHTNRRGLKKPVLIWGEEGTTDRYTKTRAFYKKKKGHFTGKMESYGFMRKTKDEVKDEVTNQLHDSIVEKITKTARKYGCK